MATSEADESLIHASVASLFSFIEAAQQLSDTLAEHASALEPIAQFDPESDEPKNPAALLAAGLQAIAAELSDLQETATRLVAPSLRRSAASSAPPS